MKPNEKTETKPVVRTGKPGRPAGLKVAWPAGALLLNLFKFNKDRAISEKLQTSVPNVFLKRQRLNKVNADKYVYLPPEKRSTASKKKAAAPVESEVAMA